MLDVALGCAVDDVVVEPTTLVLDDVVLETARLLLRGPVEDVGLELGMLLLDDKTALGAVKLLLDGVVDTGMLDGAVVLEIPVLEMPVLNNAALELAVLVMESPVDDIKLELTMVLPDDNEEVELAGPLLDEVFNGPDNEVSIELGRLMLKDAVLELRRLLLECGIEDIELELATLLADVVAIELGKLLLVDDDDLMVEGDEVEPKDVAAALLETNVLEDGSIDDVVATEDG